jgi:hypothetical protein
VIDRALHKFVSGHPDNELWRQVAVSEELRVCRRHAHGTLDCPASDCRHARAVADPGHLPTLTEIPLEEAAALGQVAVGIPCVIGGLASQGPPSFWEKQQ